MMADRGGVCKLRSLLTSCSLQEVCAQSATSRTTPQATLFFPQVLETYTRARLHLPSRKTLLQGFLCEFYPTASLKPEGNKQGGKAATMKKYGLILTGKHAKPPVSSAPVRKAAPISAFGGDDSDDEDELQARLQSERSRQYQESAKTIASAAPELADYDTFLAQKQAAEAVAREKSKAARKDSKYIGALKRNAERRSFQLEQMKERQIQREQEAEKDEFGETERFVTSAYKAKLEADKVRAEEEARLEQEEKARAKAGMAGFYANLGRAQGLGAKHDGAALQLPSAQAEQAAVQQQQQQPPLPSSSTACATTAPGQYRGQHGRRYDAGSARVAAAGASASPAPTAAAADAGGGGYDDFDDFEGGEVLMPGQVVTAAPPAASSARRSRSRSPPPRPQPQTPGATAAELEARGNLRGAGLVNVDAIAAAKARALARAAQRKAAT